MMQYTGARIVLEIIKENQIDTVFGYPGGAILPIYDELYSGSHGIRTIRGAHEQGNGTRGGRLCARERKNGRGLCDLRPRRDEPCDRARQRAQADSSARRNHRQHQHRSDW